MIHLELEANPRLGIPADLLRYNVLIGHGREEDVHTVILLLRPKANPSDLSGVYERSRLRFEYTVVRLWEEQVDAILAAGPTLAPLALLTNEAATKLDETFDRFVARLKQMDVDGKLARELFGSMFVLCGLRYEPERIAEMYRRMSMTLEDSTTYQWILKKGEAKGVAQGRSQEARQLVSKLANKKFGLFADGDAVLHRIDDPARARTHGRTHSRRHRLERSPLHTITITSESECHSPVASSSHRRPRWRPLRASSPPEGRMRSSISP